MLTKQPSNQEPMTLKEIADYEGVSPQFIAEILERSLRKARKILDDRGITAEDIL